MMTYEHIRMRMEYLEGRLRRLPKCSIRKVTQHGYIYHVVKVNKCPSNPEMEGRIYSTNKEPGKTLAQLAVQYADISRILDTLKLELNNCQSKRRKVAENKRKREPVPMRYKFFCDLKKVADSNPYPKPDNAIEYKGILMRTKGEAMIAQVLDELHYEYIYEPRVYVGKNIYPDFAVYIPEIDKVFFIEFMGALSDPDYLPSAGEKFKSFARFGYIVGRDVLFICETDRSSIDLEMLYAQISALVMANTEEY